MIPKAIYTAAEMVQLMDCGDNELANLVALDIIPPPLNKHGGKRRWSAAEVHKKLKLPPPAIVAAVNYPILQLVRDEIDRATDRKTKAGAT